MLFGGFQPRSRRLVVRLDGKSLRVFQMHHLRNERVQFQAVRAGQRQLTWVLRPFVQ